MRGTRFLHGVWVALMIVLVTSAAAAQDDLRDTLVLRNGGIVRGVVVLVEPGQQVIIRLPTGETRTYPAAAVDTVRLGATSGAADPAPGPAAPPPSAAPVPDSLVVPEPPPAAAPSFTPPAPGAAPPAQAIRTWSTPRRFTDGHSQVPWGEEGSRAEGVPDPEDPHQSDVFRIGPQIRFGGILQDHDWMRSGVFVDLGAQMQIRPVPFLHFRLGVALSVEDHDDVNRHRDESTGVTYYLSFFGFRGRVMVGFDPVPHLSIRVGGELGGMSDNSRAYWSGGASAELGYRIVAGFEILASVGAYARGGATVGPGLSQDHYAPAGRLAIGVEYLF